MPTYKRLPRGKRKAHDDFKDWSVHALIWIRDHWVTVLEAGAVLVVAIGVMIGAMTWGRYRADKGARALYEAHRFTQGSEQRFDALERVARSYSRSFAGKRAMIEISQSLIGEGKFDEAERYLGRVADGSRNQPLMRTAALHKLAEAQLAAGDAIEAAKTYRKAAVDPGNLIPLISDLLAAACLEREGDYDAAAELYKRIIGDAKDDDITVRELSEERLIWLVADGKISG